MTDDDSPDFSFNIEDPEVWKKKGDEFTRQGDFDSAIKCYSAAVESNPEYVAAWNNLGFVFFKQGKIDEAKRVKEKINSIRSGILQPPDTEKQSPIAKPVPDEALPDHPDTIGKTSFQKGPLFTILLAVGVVVVVLILAALAAVFLSGAFANAHSSTAQYEAIPPMNYSAVVTPIPPQSLDSQSLGQMKASANKVITYEELFRNYKNHIGEVVNYRGRVIQVLNPYDDYFVFRIATDGYDDVLWVNYQGAPFLEYDEVELWGTVKGLTTYTSIRGNTVTIPEIDAIEIDLVNKPTPRITTLPKTYAETPIPTISPYERYYNNNFFFSMNYPSNWYKSEQDSSQGLYKSTEIEFQSSYSGNNRAKVTVDIVNRDFGTLDEFYKTAVAAFDQSYDMTITSHQAQTIVGDQPAYRVDYYIKGDDGNIETKVMQVFVRYDEFYYIITYSAPWPRGTEENLYNAYMGKAQEMIDSVEFL